MTFTGHLKATNGGQALPNVTASFGSAITAVTDATGTFTLRFRPGTTSRLALEGGTIVARSLVASVNQTRTLEVDAIAQDGGFDMKFYRQFVRDDVDSPGLLRTLRRWADAPNIDLMTVDDKSNPIDLQTLNLTESVLRETAPLFTGGRFGVATVERGTISREGTPGWITGCRCPGGPAIGDALIRHELGHAMGFFHTDSPGDVMFHLEVNCAIHVSARERYHAAIAYARPVGNRDPDTDPDTPVYVERLRVR